jgi:hypothetical protein
MSRKNIQKKAGKLKRRYTNLWSTVGTKASIRTRRQKRLSTVVNVTILALGCASIGFLIYYKVPSRTLLRGLVNRWKNKKGVTPNPTEIVKPSIHARPPIWNRRRALVALALSILLHIYAASSDSESSELIPDISSSCRCIKWKTNIIYDEPPYTVPGTVVAVTALSLIHRLCGPAVSGTIWLGTTILAYNLPESLK